jgi:hypothetical protein
LDDESPKTHTITHNDPRVLRTSKYLHGDTLACELFDVLLTKPFQCVGLLQLAPGREIAVLSVPEDRQWVDV